MFLFHYGQAGSSRLNQQLPINVLRSGPIKYFSVNYNKHKKISNFFQESVVDHFLEGLYAPFTPHDKYKIQGYAEIINQQ